MPTEDSYKTETCYNCGDDIKGHRWRAAISNSLDREPGQGWGPRPKRVPWYWVSVCTPCFWKKRTPKGVGVRGSLLEGELR